MNVIFTQLYKVDRENNVFARENFTNSGNVDNYIMELLDKLANEQGERIYKFRDGSTTVKNSIGYLTLNQEVDINCSLLANRLLVEEIEAQEKYGHLKIEIQKGMLIISYVKMTDTESKIIISKADYNIFIEEESGDLKEGLPQKKKIFKSFIANVTLNENGENAITKLVTFDTNKKVSEYWWKEFLELDVIITDEENTRNAYNAIEKEILKPIEKLYKTDYLYLWNIIIAYFSTEGEFDITFFRDEIIGKYEPFDTRLNIDALKEKISSLPSRYKFDNRFIKKPREVTKNLKKNLSLTSEIDLLIKNFVPNLKKTIRSHEDADGKYIMIKSNSGFEYAQRVENQENANANDE